MENTPEDVQPSTNPEYSKRKILRNGTVLVLAVTFAVIHYKYVSTLFENDRHFSHLSELEREMSFRTEMGFYYSYYKTIVTEQPFLAGISKIMYDRLVEFPKEVNALNRFNIHPEVLTGAIYRYMEPWINTTIECRIVDRGPDLDPVESCIGLGVPMVFYLEAIWGLAGVMVAAVFLHAVTLSESILGGVLAVLQYFANHTECTRVQWAPNERENWASPLLFMQIWLITVQLKNKDKRTSCYIQVSIFILNCLCLLFWQFTQFIFLTQVAIFFVMEQLRIIDLKTLCIFLHSHFCGLHMAILLLQGNDMLKSSLYTTLFLTVSAYSLFFSNLKINVRNKVDFCVEAWLVVLRIGIVVLCSLYLKKLANNFFGVEEDSHIWDLLYSKLTNYKSFHTLIYTCSETFDFLPMSTVGKLFKTLLIPFVMLSYVNALCFWVKDSVNETKIYFKNFIKNIKREINIPNSNDDEDSGIENNTESIKKENGAETDDKSKMVDVNAMEFIDNYWICLLKHLRVDAAVFYNISQMVVFALLAALFMRLKLLLVTQLCILCSLIMDSKYYAHKSRWIPIFWVICGSVMIQRLHGNITQEMAIVGDFSDVHREELLQWIAGAPGGAFAGSLPLLSAVMLSTRRPILAHPHYEHKEARQRAYSVLKTYGRFSAEELYRELTSLKATYLIVEDSACYYKGKGGRCSFAEMWDIEYPTHASKPKLCHTLLTEPTDHFYPVFSNDEYTVFRIHDMSVKYMPRCFDT